jgi:hypothetical protein
MFIAATETRFVTRGPRKFFPRLNIGDADDTRSGAPESRPAMTRPSDFMVDHMRAFRVASGNALWLDIERGSLNILLQVLHPDTGLVPDFVVDDPPVPSKTGTADEGVCYECFDYNSCRVSGARRSPPPTTACPPRATSPTAWSAGRAPSTATTPPSCSRSSPSPAPARGAATTPSHRRWWPPPSRRPPPGRLNKGWAYMRGSSHDYYGGSLTLLSMLAVSGNWWIPSGGRCP